MKQYNITPDNIRDYMDNYKFDSFLEIDDKAGLDYKDEETRAIPHNSCIYKKKSKTRCVKLEIRLVSWRKLGRNTLLRQVNCRWYRLSVSR